MEVDYAKLFAHKKLGTTVWSPLASGILTGKYNKGIPEGSRFDKNQDMKHIFERYFSESKKEKTLEGLRKFQELADELKISMAQLSLAWVISNPDVSTAITGASSPKQLEETLKAVEYQKLITPEIEKRIEAIFETAPTGKINMKTFAPEPSRRVKMLQ
jgi:aryl-alcohol dehydrogenase-like predicted oxidoreductase